MGYTYVGMELLEKVKKIIENSKIEELELQKLELQEKLESPEIWSNTEAGTKLSKEISSLENQIAEIKNLNDLVENIEIATELEENPKNLIKELETVVLKIENLRYFTGKFDKKDALMTIYAGAGGIDAQDWTAMLCSMYQSFCKNMGWNCSIIAISCGDEGGIKSVTLKISGEFVYGLLKEEIGVHRLVRISPFNSGGTRETSFAMVELLPEGLDNEIKIEINEKDDLDWDFYMSSGKGGQSVNTTYSAVRVTHRPSGIVVTCQNERSQIQNKAMAIKYLKNKLAILELQKQKDYIGEIKGNLIKAEWGSQIRNYVLHPYKLVKDTRSGWETGNVDKILQNGDLLELIWSIKQKT
jgi:peptide chain release factor 2